MWTLILLSACANQDNASVSPVSKTVAITQNSADGNPADSTDGSEDPSSDISLADLKMDSWESSLVHDIVEEVRKGVQLYGEEGFGLCTPGENNRCDLFIGSQHEVLPHGEYFVRAEVQAPASADGWKVEYESDCTVSHRDGKVEEKPPKTTIRPVKYKANRAYPVRFPKVISPSKRGKQVCTFKLSSVRPDGTKTLIEEGGYTLPMIGGEAPERLSYLEKFKKVESPVSTDETPVSSDQGTK